MKKIEMGVYYDTNNGMVKTIGKAADTRDGTAMIIYCRIGENGYAGDTLVMPERDFKEMI
jgi:hypothetical protein